MNSEADGGSSLKEASSVFARIDAPSIRQVLTVIIFFFYLFLGIWKINADFRTMYRRAFYGWAGPQEYMWVSKDPRQLSQRAQLKVSIMANLWYLTTGLVLVRK